MSCRHTLLLCVLLAAGCRHAPPAVHPSGGATALVAVVTRGGWMFHALEGTEAPDFVLYDDGSVIFWRRDARGELTELASVMLTHSELEAWLQSVPLAQLETLPSEVGRRRGHHDPVTVIFQWSKGARHGTRAWGWLCPKRVFELNSGADVGGCSREDLDATPIEFQAVLERTKTFTHPRARPWLPELLEVWLLPFEEARGTPEHWPAHWPGPGSPSVRPAGFGQHLRIMLPSTELAHLERLMATLADSRAVEFGGRKFSLDVRLPFPGDEAWRSDIPRVH